MDAYLISAERTGDRAAPVLKESPVAELCPVDALAGEWLLVHTKARQEKALADDLERMGIGHYLPLVRLRRRYGGRTIQVQMPLFPSYVFLCGGDEERYTTLMTHRAARVINVVDQERLKTELRQVYRVTMSKESVNLYPAIRPGRRCRVTRGSLAGLEGVVLRRRGVCRVSIGVDALGQSAELEIDPSLIEIIE